MPVGPEPIVPDFARNRGAQSPDDFKREFCAKLYNEILEEKMQGVKTKMDAARNGTSAGWTADKATLDDMKQIVYLGLHQECLHPSYWKGSEKHAIELIDQLPLPIQETLDVVMARQRLFGFAKPSARVESSARSGLVQPPVRQKGDGG